MLWNVGGAKGGAEHEITMPKDGLFGENGCFPQNFQIRVFKRPRIRVCLTGGSEGGTFQPAGRHASDHSDSVDGLLIMVSLHPVQ